MNLNLNAADTKVQIQILTTIALT